MTIEKNKTNNLIITAVLLIVVGVSSFYGGIFYQKTQAKTAFGQFSVRDGVIGRSQAGMMRSNETRGFGGAVVGDIVSIDSDSLTIKLQDGSSKIINLSSKTTYSKTEAGSISDLKSGVKVAAIGITNPDGSISAQNVQINPAFRMITRKQSFVPAN